MSNIISVILILASLGMLFVYVDPLYSSVSAPDAPVSELSIKELKAKKVEYDRALSNSREYQQEKEKLLKKFNEIPDGEKTKLGKLLPDHIDNVRLIIDIDEMAKKFDIRARNFKASSGDEKDTIGTDSTPYGTLTLSFSTSATYTTFLAFLRDLEQSLRLIDVTSVTFASGDGPIYDYEVTLKTYWLK